MNCMTPNMDCADSFAVRDFCKRKKPEFQCGCPNAAQRAGKNHDVLPSAPLRPTSNSHTTVTQTSFFPPLRPTGDATVTHTTTTDLAQRNEVGYMLDVDPSNAAKYELQCNGPNLIENNFVQVCNNGFMLPISGESCQKWCRCDDKGRISCDSPAEGCPESFAAVAGFCSSKMPDFTCSCTKKETQDTHVPNLLEVSRQSGLIPRELNSMTCNGADTTTRIDTGVVCADGSTLHWSGETCAQYCTCNGDAIACDLPSDCGPARDINAFCAIGPNFTCQCPQKAKHREIEAPALPSPENVILAREPIAEKQSSMICTGSDMVTRFDTGVVCLDGNTLHWSGDVCAQYCSCSGGLIHCDAPADCGSEDQLSAWCAVGPNYKFICDCSVEKREVSITTNNSNRDNIVTIKSDHKPVQREVASPMIPAIGNGNNYAMVCKDSKETTTYCQSFELQYYCTDNGKVKFKGEMGDWSSCDEWCTCYNLNPKPYCYLGWTTQNQCLGKREDGSEFVEYHSREVIEEMERRGEVVVLQDLDASPDLHETTSYDAIHLGPPVEAALTPRQNKQYSPNWAYACYGTTDDMNKYMLMDTCTNPYSLTYLNGQYCKTHCGCDDHGCVTCDAYEPEFIADCGGDEGAARFCGEKVWLEFQCGCASKSTGLPGCGAVDGGGLERRADEALAFKAKPATTLATIWTRG